MGYALNMTTKWTSKAFSGNDSGMPPSGMFDEQFIVLLLYGKNSFGDKIYSYLKITLANLRKLKAAIDAKQGFVPSDFGEVVAAGRDEPTPEIRAEIAAMYPIMDDRKAQKPVTSAPVEKKAWDEY